MGSSNRLPFCIEMVYASNATAGDGSRNRAFVLFKAAFASGIRKLANAYRVNGDKKVRYRLQLRAL